MRFLGHLLITTFALMLTAYIFPTNVMLGGVVDTLIVALIFSVLNAFLKPILEFLAFPLTFFTFGIFSLFINAAIILLTSYFAPGFEVEGFVTALLFSIVLSLITTIIFSIFGIKE